MANTNEDIPVQPVSPATMALAGKGTGVMEYIRILEGTLKTERANFQTRLNEEVAFKVVGTRFRWIAVGMGIPLVVWLLFNIGLKIR